MNTSLLGLPAEIWTLHMCDALCLLGTTSKEIATAVNYVLNAATRAWVDLYGNPCYRLPGGCLHSPNNDTPALIQNKAQRYPNGSSTVYVPAGAKIWYYMPAASIAMGSILQ